VTLNFNDDDDQLDRCKILCYNDFLTVFTIYTRRLEPFTVIEPTVFDDRFNDSHAVIYKIVEYIYRSHSKGFCRRFMHCLFEPSAIPQYLKQYKQQM